MSIENYNLVIKTIQLNDIFEHGTTKYNSNNHWINNKKPNNYDVEMSLSNTNMWIDLFKLNYKTITIDKSQDIDWLKKANHIYSIIGKFSDLFLDDLDELLNKFESINNIFFNGNKYFVRVNNVSLKYGVHGLGPYDNLKDILESSISSPSGHCPISKDMTKLNIYLIPWINIEEKNEFRVFVYKHKITTISQQNLYKKLHIDDIPIKINIIVKYFYEVINEKINWISNYIYDFAIINDNEPYFIEINPFGKEMSSGSALFHWLLDEDVLYNETTNDIEFRYTI